MVTWALPSIAGLLIPAAEEGSPASVVLGFLAGAALLGVARSRLDADTHFMGHSGPGARTSALVFGVLFVHSLPEGLAIGTAFASDRAGLSLFVIVAIAIQNIPEGTSVAIPMAAEGFSRTRQFWAAVATSAPQPVGALIAFLLVEQIEALLPFSFAFAAGAMLALIAVEMLPKAYGPGAPAAERRGDTRGGGDARAEHRPRGLTLRSGHGEDAERHDRGRDQAEGDSRQPADRLARGRDPPSAHGPWPVSG